MEARTMSAGERAGKTFERPPLVRAFGKLLIFTSFISLVAVGFVINVPQFLLCLTFQLGKHNSRWRRVHKRIMNHLVTIQFAPCIFLIYYWARMHLNLLLNDIRLVNAVRKPILALMLPNHSHDIDYLIMMALGDQLDNFGACKSVAKDELKYLPVLGWGFWMSDVVFVKRNWAQDRKPMMNQLAHLLDYDQTLICLFCEGTRWTPAKQLASAEEARARGLEPLRWHLMPRPRGFAGTISYYLGAMAAREDKKELRLFNLEIAMPGRPTFRDFVAGNQIRADIYLEEVVLPGDLRQRLIDEPRRSGLEPGDLSRAPELERELNEFLFKLYKRKDEIVESYRANGNKFVESEVAKSDDKRAIPGHYPYKPSTECIFFWAAGMMLTYGSLAYAITYTWLGASKVFWGFLVTLVTFIFLLLQRVESESTASDSEKTEQLASSGSTEKTKQKLKLARFGDRHDNDSDDKKTTEQ